MFVGRLHVIIFVSDVVRSVAFYKEVLGFGFKGYWDASHNRIQESWDDASQPDYAELFVGENRIGLRPSANVVPASAIECSIEVEDVGALFRSALEKGAHLPGPVEQPWGARTLTIEDPDGHVWHFFQHLSP